MVTARITKQAVEALKADDNPAFLWDSILKGFGVKATPGGRKLYIAQYRLGGRAGTTRRVTLGPHGPLTPDQARRMAMNVLSDVASGTDVAAEKSRRKQEERTAPTIAAAVDDFLAVHVRPKLKKSTAAEYERLLRKFIVPRIGHIKVRDLTHSQVGRLHHDMRDTPIQANRCYARLSSFIAWCIKAGLRPDRVNPCHGLKKFRERASERYLSDMELAALGEAIRSLEENGRITSWAAAARASCTHYERQCASRPARRFLRGRPSRPTAPSRTCYRY